MRRGVYCGLLIGMVAALSFVEAADLPSSKGALPKSVEAIKGKDGAPMLLVPAGPFLMGANDGLPNERPEHTVTIKAFYIDQYEVTSGRYQQFLELGKRGGAAPTDEDSGRSLEDRPVVGVTWTEAAAYCAWAGKRLPD